MSRELGPIELRVSTMATTFGEKVVIRVVDNSAGIKKLEQLGFSPEILPGFRRSIGSPNGIVLVTGPTGSGKSTTLYAALNEVVSPRINISSIEDPVENHIKGINQFQVNFTHARKIVFHNLNLQGWHLLQALQNIQTATSAIPF